MDLIRLRYFERVARLASFTRAAEELHVAQPALSKHVAALEREFGRRVFERAGHSIILTDAGRRLLAHTERLLEDYARLQVEMGQLSGSASYTQLRVGASHTIADHLLSGVVATFAQQHPRVQLMVESNLSHDLTKGLVEGRLEAVIGVLPSFDRLVNEEMLFEEEYVLMLPPNHTWKGRREVTFGELREEPVIVVPNLRGHRDFMAAACRLHGFRPPIRAEVTSHDLIATMVRAGVAPALVPSVTLDASLSWTHIVEPKITRQIGWMERRGSPSTEARRIFHELLVQHCRGLKLTRPSKI
jgi:DNA-binding transcriptional LysR family regulator